MTRILGAKPRLAYFWWHFQLVFPSVSLLHPLLLELNPNSHITMASHFLPLKVYRTEIEWLSRQK